MARKTRKAPQTDLDDLLTLGPAAEPTIHDSRKTKRVTVRYPFEGADWSVSLPRAGLEAVCQRLNALSPDERAKLVCKLTDALIEKYMTTPTDGKRKAEQRAFFLTKVKYAAAWAYLFCGQQQRKSDCHRHSAFMLAERACATHIKDWSAYLLRERRILLTAFLVIRAFKTDWKRHALSDPVKKPEASDSFYLTYILPRLKELKLLSQSDPTSLHPDVNAYLRFLFQTDSDSTR